MVRKKCGRPDLQVFRDERRNSSLQRDRWRRRRNPQSHTIRSEEVGRPLIVGNPKRFAIEVEPRDFRDRWVLGGFRLWLFGRAFGDWSDAADLVGCVGWLEHFASTARDRFEPILDSLPAADVFARIYDPSMSPDARWDERVEGVGDVYSRFCISHVGMSSLDRVDVLLLYAADGSERCLCREMPGGAIFEFRLEAGEIEAVAAKFASEFRQAIAERQIERDRDR